MNHINRILLLIVAVTSLVTESLLAQSAPSEQTQVAVQRTANSGASLNARLTKNLFKNESVQVPYTVQVPYQTTEQYTEKVPYTVQVPYTDYETDYKTEYRCETVTKYRNERRCENVTRYRSERRCDTQTDYVRECRTVRECDNSGGGRQCRNVEECGLNAQGQRICKTRQVCEDRPQYQQCADRQVCENVPKQSQQCRYVDVPYYEQECRNEQVPYRDQECRNEQVAYQKPVTRYKNETKYRDEVRTRNVTKYRNETKCCKTETQTVFDRQLQFQVQLQFPVEAQLVAQEIETLQVQLISTNPAQVQIKGLNTLYGYQIISQSQSGELIFAQLGLTPLFDLNNAGLASIQNLKAQFSKTQQKFIVNFTDAINHPKVISNYEIEIKDLATGASIEKGVPVQKALGYEYVLNTQLDINAQFVVVLKTIRQGVVVSQGQIGFVKELKYDKRTFSIEDLELLGSNTQVKLTAPVQSGKQTFLKLIDLTEKFENVRTQYILSLFEVKNGRVKAINTPQKISREQADAAHNEVTLALLLGKTASSYLVPGKMIRAEIQVQRQITDNSAISPRAFVVTTDIVIQ